jgi:hypothetical protein
MTGRLVRNPPAIKPFSERFKIELPGFQPLKAKIDQAMLAKYYLLHEHGIYNAGMTHIYTQLLDEHGQPIKYFSDGRSVGDWHLVIDAPYPCAADHYDQRYSPSSPRAAGPRF